MTARTVPRAQQYHGGPKKNITGGGKHTGAGAPAPAWRSRNMPTGTAASKQARSKVLLSNLPVDVDEVEIVVSLHLINILTSAHILHVHKNKFLF